MGKLLYDHKWMDLYEDAEGEAFVQMSHDAVMVVAFTEDHNVLFVQEKSIAYQIDMLSLPMGGVDEGELPAVAANRELQEETGYRGGEVKFVGTLYPSIKYLRWTCHVFLARDLIVSRLQGDETSRIRVRPIPIRFVNRLVSTGQLNDSTAVAALHLVWRHMKSVSRVDLMAGPELRPHLYPGG